MNQSNQLQNSIYFKYNFSPSIASHPLITSIQNFNNVRNEPSIQSVYHRCAKIHLRNTNKNKYKIFLKIEHFLPAMEIHPRIIRKRPLQEPSEDRAGGSSRKTRRDR